MPDITFRFEDLPLHRDGEFVSLLQSGTAIISYDQHGNWQVDSISLDLDNGKAGPEARGIELKLSPSGNYTLWKLVDDALSREANEAIVDLIVADLPYSDPNAEHRLGARQLGVGSLVGAW